VCEGLRDEPIYQFLKDNGKTLKALLAEAEITMHNCDPAIFEEFFFYKKRDFCEFNVMRKFNEWLSECHSPNVLKLKEMRAQAVADALKSGIFDFAPTPSQREMDEAVLDPIIHLLPYNFELTEEFKVAFAKFKRFVKMEGSILKFNYKSYGKYLLNHFYDFDSAQVYAIFELDVMLFLIHQEMKRLEPGQEKCLNPTVNEQPECNQQKPDEELFHFIHPSLDDEEGWKIHNEVKRLVRRMSLPDIIKYLRKLASKDIVLLPLMPSSAYVELVRMGMPSGEGFSEKYFRNCYMK